MKKFKKIGISFIFLLAFILAVSNVDTMQAAATGYHDVAHNFTANDDCGGCSTTVGGVYYTNKASYTSTKCTACKGNGKGYEFKCSSCSKKYYGTSASPTARFYCSTSNVSVSGTTTKTCTTCSGTGKWGKCTHCNGKGVNYKCQNANCVPKYTTYDNWKTESGYNAVCYTAANTYTVVYKGNNNTGGSTANSSHTYGTAKALTANGFTKTGYTFWGWSTSSTAPTPTYTNGQSVSNLTATNGGTVTLYAVWQANTYSVTYDANGGTDAPAKQEFLFGSKDAISLSEPSRTGYTFLNWWATHTTSTYFTPGDEIPASWGNFTLKARWSANSYTITLAPNGGTCVNDAGENVDSVTTTFDTMDFNALSYCVPTRIGYTFKGWYDALEGGTQVYNADGLCTNEGTYWKDSKWAYADNVTLYAQWEQNEYTVTYNSNGGSTENTTRTYYYNDEVDLSVPAEKDGKIFVGWSTDPNAKAALNAFIMPDLATTEYDDNKETLDVVENDWELTLYAIYSIQVSDVANHTYPDYGKVKEQEVFLHIWEYGNADNCKDYPLSYEYDTNTMVYRYTADFDTTDFVKNMSAYCYAVYAYDNAGNWHVLATDIISSGSDAPDTEPTPPGITAQKYTQTVNHYRYDTILKSWVKFDTTKEEVEKGKIFTPSFVTAPTGYQTDSITYPEGYTITNGSYVVSKPATSNAYYKPMDYTLFFDVNASDGSVSPTKKTVTYGGRYGELPTPERTGYTFKGWYTTKEDEMLIVSSMKYEIPGDSTVYAHWERNSYEVIYDYWTNGGTYCSVLSQNTLYGSAVDLAVTASKNGYTFVGWNTDPDATSKLDSLIMENKELVLYAIYKKDITAIFVDSNNGTKRTVTTTVYNNQTDGAITIPAQNTISGWTSLGWSFLQEAEASIDTTPGAEYILGENTMFYGCYVKDVTLSYDTNGSGQSFDSETKERYYNAFGNYSNPMFTITATPTLSDHSFVAWVDNTTGDEYQPGDAVEITADTLLTARWDTFPEIEAYNRYFTLAQAKNGDITEEELLKKVIGTDKEDGILVNGSSVIVKDYSSSMFTSIASEKTVEITYQAIDNYGNTVEKTVTITVTDTTAKKSNTKKYVRFISSRFFKDNKGNMISSSEGGLEETSIWRRKNEFYNLLDLVLSGVVKEKETWMIKYEDIKRLRGSL